MTGCPDGCILKQKARSNCSCNKARQSSSKYSTKTKQIDRVFDIEKQLILAARRNLDSGFTGEESSQVQSSVSLRIHVRSIGPKLFSQEQNRKIKEGRRWYMLTQLILTAAVRNTPDIYLGNASFPVDSVRDNLDWIHVMTFGYYTPQQSNVTGALAALFDPLTNASSDYGIRVWIDRGMSFGKLALALPFHGYAWKLKNPDDNDK
jgi:hypothetical protein